MGGRPVGVLQTTNLPFSPQTSSHHYRHSPPSFHNRITMRLISIIAPGMYINDTIYYTQYLQYVIIMFGRPVSHKCSQYIYYFHAFANNEILASADCYLQLEVPSSLSFVLVLRPRHALQPLEVSSLLHFVLFPRPRHALQKLCTLFQAPVAVEKLDGSWCLSFHAVLALSGP